MAVVWCGLHGESVFLRVIFRESGKDIVQSA
nr:MAG TPA: hypothetical protein [Caudoviricetes sp.]